MGKKAFTLIEVLAVAVILSVTIAGFVNLFITANKYLSIYAGKG